MKAQVVCFLLGGLILFNACRKTGSPGPEDPGKLDTLPHEPGVSAPNLPGLQNTIAGYRISSVDYNSDPGATAYYHYNSDSTLRQIQYKVTQRGTTNVDYTYNNKAISQIVTDGSENKIGFLYEKGWINTISHTSVITNRGYKFIYTYNMNGTVAIMRYYNKNEAGDHLIYTNTYTYDSNRLPKKITSVANNSTTIVWTIDGYSEECAFNPWTFTNIGLNELYSFYNLPVLSQLNRLPKKFSKAFINSSGVMTSEMSIEYNYTLTGKRLDKVIISTRYPANPQSNYSSEMLLHY